MGVGVSDIASQIAASGGKPETIFGGPIWEKLRGYKPTPIGPINPTAPSRSLPGVTTPGYDPLADPTYRQIASEYAAMSQSERLAMEAGIARQKAYYGTPDEPLSLFGRLKGGYDIRNRDVQNILNAHGMWRSGETGYQLGQSTLKYTTDALDMAMRLQDYINGLQGNFARSESERRLSLIDWAWKLAQAQAQVDSGDGGPPTDPGDPTKNPPDLSRPPNYPAPVLPTHPSGLPGPWPKQPIYNVPRGAPVYGI